MAGRKRTIHEFFGGGSSTAVEHSPASKRPVAGIEIGREPDVQEHAILQAVPTDKHAVHTDSPASATHASWPCPISALPPELEAELIAADGERSPLPARPDLDAIYFKPWLTSPAAAGLFKFLRGSLPFYRVEYKIKRGSVETQIKTPRWTTVFGIDATSKFVDGTIVDATTKRPVPSNAYRCAPRSLPPSLRSLKDVVEQLTGCDYNFVLVNYYADGSDSISYHSDDERFLGALPAIASLSLGASRDFFLRHKSVKDQDVKLGLAGGDLLLMKGTTQSKWLHAIPKRANATGRINVTFRKALVKGGTENYYRYNVHGDVKDGPQVYRWSDGAHAMVPMRPDAR